MLFDGLKISWRNFRSGFIVNLATLIILIVSNAAMLSILMLGNNVDLKIVFCAVLLVGYLMAIVLSALASKHRAKEVIIRKMLGARFSQIFILTTIDSSIYMGASALFSVIIIEHIYERTGVLSGFTPLLMIKFIVILFVLSLIIGLLSALKLNSIESNK